MTSTRALNRLAALPNFMDMQGKDRKAVCDLFNLLQTAHAAIADASSILASLGQRLHPNQFQFLLKHSMHPLIQLQIPAHLCHPGKLRFMKQHLTDNELYEQHCVNTLLPRPHHLDLDNIPPKHPTRALAAAIHYQLRKQMCLSLIPHRLKLPIYFKLREKSFLHPSWDENMTLVRNQPNQKNLKHQPPRRTSQQRNMQMSHSHLSHLQLQK